MRQNRGCLMNTFLFLLCVFVPLVGHLIETVMILDDDHSSVGKVFWLAVVWLIPFVGAFLYLLFGQRPVNRAPVMFGQASSVNQPYPQYQQPQAQYPR